ncbi:Microsomal dipeptidase [Planococcus halocryophilus Or1]|uniref:Diguanylate cyclase n=1 Tax=Planococcus halocryophilus TaxID=1215089 RepID=A0A1C7DS21_9BACL|nr:dipeptidase [Planococcus halocryophilus]ANU14197.1 diguanylate cyclase [Planococcus halocryophilus]EMF46073.1 Microsomal dipeptidase [Planococcus halocryophilus Or1]
MKIFDTHCDALLKLQMAKRNALFHGELLNFQQSKELDTNFERLQAGGVKVQFFAIFIHPEFPSDEKWQHALEQIDLFYSEILGNNPLMKHIKNWKDIDSLKPDEIGAVLTLEGADAFGNDLMKLRQLYRLGVLSIGLTWNNANLCADGVGDPRDAGLTLLGKEVVRLNNEHHVFTDVSHLSINGFWDVMELAKFPIASHSNARALCDHPRNLNDQQIKAMFEKSGMIDVVFCPDFINKDSEQATIPDLIRHIDHFCALGGVNNIGIGSDFDGISSYITDLNNASEFPNLINELQKHYSEAEVEGFAYRNFLEHRPGM